MGCAIGASPNLKNAGPSTSSAAADFAQDDKAHLEGDKEA
jgi:cytochrome c551/c552